MLDRHEGRCRGCGAHKATQIHHLTYERFGPETLFYPAAIWGEHNGRIPRKTYWHCDNIDCDWLGDIVILRPLNNTVLNLSLSGYSALVCPQCRLPVVQWDPHEESPDWAP